eukprot:981550-Rhodomonas_salina.2
MANNYVVQAHGRLTALVHRLTSGITAFERAMTQVKSAEQGKHTQMEAKIQDETDARGAVVHAENRVSSQLAGVFCVCARARDAWS